jgi:hypothetical protein
MERISSRFTFWAKWVFPTAWFGFLAFFVIVTVGTGVAQKDLFFVFVPVVMAIFGFFLMRKVAWDLADSVDDFGSYLLIRRKGKEVRVEFKDVKNVSVSTFVNPPRITLKLVKPTELGDEISFSPRVPISLNPFAKNLVGEALIERVYRAHGGNAL